MEEEEEEEERGGLRALLGRMHGSAVKTWAEA